MSSTKAPETLAVFDFDGTLTTKDSMLAFCRFVVGPVAYATGFLSLLPSLIAFKLGRLSNTDAKELFLARFLGGKSRRILESTAEKFAEYEIPRMLRPRGLAKVQEYQAAGCRVVIVSASLDLWLKPWAESVGVELLCSNGAWEGESFTGKLNGPNCHGPEKVERLLTLLKGQRPSRVIAYGDSSGDTELLEWADEGFFKPFR